MSRGRPGPSFYKKRPQKVCPTNGRALVNTRNVFRKPEVCPKDGLALVCTRNVLRKPEVCPQNGRALVYTRNTYSKPEVFPKNFKPAQTLNRIKYKPSSRCLSDVHKGPRITEDGVVYLIICL